jgi:hypothetical protein
VAARSAMIWQTIPLITTSSGPVRSPARTRRSSAMPVPVHNHSWRRIQTHRRRT